ncbi:hypothetical protein [Roseomonas sp. CECT 9278]|uniref:hypothetical protein n=1 Tax=Roseomonas sp. CECT 9278 TaxID=2845823 RepID=UPI001E5BCCA6|nr:hypothetical protein [Roseomonas sp. CECT 9278]CAH0169637.1 hypothetical protein ROS9278_01163 [Roseomonas sp. CECT 9278]
MAIHHATAARAARLGLTLTEEAGQVVVRFEDVIITAAENPKAALQAAADMLEEAGYEEYNDLASDLEQNGEHEGGQPGDLEDPEPEEEEGGQSALARQMAKFRARYVKDETGRTSNGDEVALALGRVCQNLAGPELRAALEDLAARNAIDAGRWAHLKTGQFRMNLGNVLRGKVRRGEEVVGL